MAEQFIEDIYHDAMIIEYIKEYIYLISCDRYRDARPVYNRAAGELERLIRNLAPDNRELAINLQNTAYSCVDIYDDTRQAQGIVEGQLIPAMYQYMSYFTDIEVDTGRYLIKSSDTGFLTIYDHETGLYIHSTYDPMWEAYQAAKSIFDPAFQQYRIFGVGLGYLPYQLWKLSGGASKIIIYENDKEMLRYAYDYGVLSWISEDDVEIVQDDDLRCLGIRFCSSIGNTSDCKQHISFWKRKECISGKYEEITRLAANLELEISTKNVTRINLWKNKGRISIPFEQLKNRYNRNEWLIVAAGPSLNDNIDFIKSSIGKRGIIAVNSTLRRLAKEKIIPDIAVAADRYSQMEEHLSGIEDYTRKIPLIADWLTNWRFTEKYQGEFCFVTTSASLGSIQEDNDDIWEIGGTVSSLAIETTIRIGAKRVYFIGLDLAYPLGKRYADGMQVDNNLNNMSSIMVKSVEGIQVPTSEAFCWFREVIERQIRNHPDIDFINMSTHGAYIEGTHIDISS